MKERAEQGRGSRNALPKWKAYKPTSHVILQMLLQCPWLIASFLNCISCVESSIFQRAAHLITGQHQLLGNSLSHRAEMLFPCYVGPLLPGTSLLCFLLTDLSTLWRQETILLYLFSKSEPKQFLWWGPMLSLLSNLPVTLLWMSWDLPSYHYNLNEFKLSF